MDDGLDVLQVPPENGVILAQIAEQHKHQRIRTAVDEGSQELQFWRLGEGVEESFGLGLDLGYSRRTD